jgi:TonB family protein
VLESAGQERGAEKTRATSRKWASVLAASLALALAAIAIVPRLLNRQTKSAHISEAPSIQPQQIRAQPRPEQKPTTSQDAAPVSSRVRNAEPPAPKAKTSSPDFVPGEVFHQVLPEVPSKARQTIRGKVKVSVRVHIDPSGSVTLAELDSAGPSKYFAQLALEAARRWKFVPAKATDREIADEWILRFEFFRTETKAVPVRSFPRHN